MAANLDAGMQKIFDEIQSYMALNYATCNVSVIQDPAGRTETITVRDFRGNETSYTNRAVGNKVVISPPNASLAANGTQQFKATALDPEGKPVENQAFSWTMQPGALGSVSESGLYSAPASIASMTADVVTATLHGALSAASVTVGLRPPS